MLGLYVSDHPLFGLEHVLSGKADAGIAQLTGGEHSDGAVVTIGGIISGLQRKMTKQGNAWAIATVEDLAGSIECITHNFFRLSSDAYAEGWLQKWPRMDKETISQGSEGIVASTGCPSGEVQTRLRLGQEEEALKAAADYQDIFGKDRYFLELMDHGIDIEHRVRDGLLEIGRKLGIPPLVTNDSHYTYAHEAAAHDALLCIQTGKNLSDPDRFKFDGTGYYLKSTPTTEPRATNLHANGKFGAERAATHRQPEALVWPRSIILFIDEGTFGKPLLTTAPVATETHGPAAFEGRLPSSGQGSGTRTAPAHGYRATTALSDPSGQWTSEAFRGRRQHGGGPLRTTGGHRFRRRKRRPGRKPFLLRTSLRAPTVRTSLASTLRGPLSVRCRKPGG